MKKVRLIIVLIVAMFLFNIKAFAASATLSVSSNSVSVGDKFTVYVNMKSSAAWNIHVSSNGPVSGCVINQADTTADAMDTTKTFSAECVATSEGTININLSGDVTSAADGISVNISGKTSINVNKKSSNTNSGGNTSNKAEVKSKNNKIKDLSVDGYVLRKIDEKNYELSVSKDVSNINIKGTPEDSKAKITGIGEKKLTAGENKFEIVVTSESGLKNVINIKVLKKDEYNLDDLSTLLNNSDMNSIDISIDYDDVISKDFLDKIRDSKKIVFFNVLDENKKNIYSWIVDGSKIGEGNDFKVTVNNKTEYDDKILKLSNYADGIFVNFLQENSFPQGIIAKLFVGDKYVNGNELNIYSYDIEKNKLNIEKKVMVEDGYIYLDNLENYIYFVTMSSIDREVLIKENNNIFFEVVSIIELLIIICLVITFIYKRKSFNNIDNNQNLSSNNVGMSKNINNDINSNMYNNDIYLSNINNNMNNNNMNNNNMNNNNMNNNGNIF